MAKKTDKQKEKKQKKEIARYDPFISGPLTTIIKSHASDIRELCERRPGIEEFTSDEWKQLDFIVLEVLKAAADARFKTHFMRMTPLKHITPYSLTCKVREEQAKGFIINWISRIDEEQELLDEWDVHCCWEIFCHLAVMIAENSRNPEQQKKKES